MKKIKTVIIVSIVIVVAITIAFIVLLLFDAFNVTGGVGSNLKFDWLTGGCTFFAAASSLFLGVVAIVQNIKANESNERLAKINDAQLENSIVSQNYPIIKFWEEQTIKMDINTFELKFSDIRNTPLEKVRISDVQLYPYSERYKLDENATPVSVWRGHQWIQTEFTPNKGSGGMKDTDGFYLVNIEIDPAVFQKHQFYRVEFKIDVMSTAKVVTTYKRYCLLAERADSIDPTGTRRHPMVYHQFCEFGKTVSEREYRKLSTLSNNK